MTRCTVDVSPGTVKPIPARMLARGPEPHTWLLDEGTMRINSRPARSLHNRSMANARQPDDQCAACGHPRKDHNARLSKCDGYDPNEMLPVVREGEDYPPLAQCECKEFVEAASK